MLPSCLDRLTRPHTESNFISVVWATAGLQDSGADSQGNLKIAVHEHWCLEKPVLVTWMRSIQSDGREFPSILGRTWEEPSQPQCGRGSSKPWTLGRPRKSGISNHGVLLYTDSEWCFFFFLIKSSLSSKTTILYFILFYLNLFILIGG